jgi:predicted Zn-dependent protease
MASADRKGGRRPRCLQCGEGAEPRFTEADLALAALDAQEGKIDVARSELTGVLAAQPKNEAANLMLAELEFTPKNMPAAVVHFAAVVEQNPDNVVALNAAYRHI